MKIDTKNHFKQESHFIDHYLNENVGRVELNRKRLLLDASDFNNQKKTSGAINLEKKINSFIKRRNISMDTKVIVDKILSGDEVYQGIFMIDPKKQNGSDLGNEATQVNYIQEKLNIFSNVKILRLDNHGPNSERILNGKLIKGTPKSSDTTKSLDCEIINPKNIKIRTINKITTSLIKEVNDGGGAQSNQLELCEKGVGEIDFSEIDNQNLIIIFILDGKFYVRNNYVFELIKKYEKNENVYFTTSDGIQEVIRAILYN